MVQRSDIATKLIFIKCANKVVTNNIEGEASATEKQLFQSAILRETLFHFECFAPSWTLRFTTVGP